MSDNIYVEMGYKSRKDYLRCLAEDMGFDLVTVCSLANMLGSGEDFDGLVTMLEDMQQ